MIGLVLVTHGRLADEMIAAMEHVVGPQEQIVTVCIGPIVLKNTALRLQWCPDSIHQD